MLVERFFPAADRRRGQHRGELWPGADEAGRPCHRGDAGAPGGGRRPLSLSGGPLPQRGHPEAVRLPGRLPLLSGDPPAAEGTESGPAPQPLPGDVHHSGPVHPGGGGRAAGVYLPHEVRCGCGEADPGSAAPGERAVRTGLQHLRLRRGVGGEPGRG